MSKSQEKRLLGAPRELLKRAMGICKCKFQWDTPCYLVLTTGGAFHVYGKFSRSYIDDIPNDFATALLEKSFADRLVGKGCVISRHQGITYVGIELGSPQLVSGKHTLTVLAQAVCKVEENG